jgi:hypothetical protein
LYLNAGDTVEWQVYYKNSDGSSIPSQAIVTIGNFRGENDSSIKGPFDKETYGITATANYASPKTDTGTTKPSTGTPKITTYKYSISIQINGLPQFTIDPRVVLSDGGKH